MPDNLKTRKEQELEAHARELFWSRLFSCFVGGCFALVSLLDHFDFSSPAGLLQAYITVLLSGILFGLSIRIVSGIFDFVIERMELPGIRKTFIVFCLVFPLVFLLLHGKTPLF